MDKNKIFTIPNIISLFRLIFLTPLAGYFFLTGNNLLGVLFSASVVILDIADGKIARKFNQITRLGSILDAGGDLIFLILIALVNFYLDYLNLLFLALIALHRITRIIPVIILWKKKKAIYLPMHMKAFGFTLMVYLFLIPLLVEYFGQEATDNITLTIIAGTYIPLLISVVIAVLKFKKGLLNRFLS